MKKIAALILALPFTAAAQFKCTDTEGKVSFQQAPCEGRSRQQSLILKAAPEAQPTPDTTRPASGQGESSEAKTVRMMERDRRVRELTMEVAAAEASVGNRNAAMSAEMAALKNRKQLANNNLAGATWEQSLSAEMQAVAAKYRAINEVELERLKQLRAELATAKQVAGKP